MIRKNDGYPVMTREIPEIHPHNAESEITYELRKKFRDRRLERNLNQYTLSKDAYVSPNTIADMETGYRNVGINALVRISVALNCRIELVPLEEE